MPKKLDMNLTPEQAAYLKQRLKAFATNKPVIIYPDCDPCVVVDSEPDPFSFDGDFEKASAVNWLGEYTRLKMQEPDKMPSVKVQG